VCVFEPSRPVTWGSSCVIVYHRKTMQNVRVCSCANDYNVYVRLSNALDRDNSTYSACVSDERMEGAGTWDPVTGHEVRHLVTGSRSSLAGIQSGAIQRYAATYQANESLLAALSRPSLPAKRPFRNLRRLRAPALVEPSSILVPSLS